MEENREKDMKSTDGSRERSAKRSTGRSVERSNGRCKERSTRRSARRSIQRRIQRSTGRSTGRSTDKSSVRSTERSSDTREVHSEDDAVSRVPLMFDYIILTVGTNCQLPPLRTWQLSFLALEFALCACATCCTVAG